MISQVDLNYFIELGNTLHLTRAAERIGISQPALSHSLKRLESELGVTLFTRSKKGMKLTAAGVRLKDSASNLVAMWNEVRSAVTDEIEEARGVIRVGCHSAVAQYTLPNFLPKFMADHESIAVELTHGLSRHMTEQVVSENLDVAIVVNPIPNPDLIIKELCRDQVSVWQLKRNQNSDVLIIEPSLLQTQDILRKLAKVNIEFKRVIESSSLEVIASLVSAGAGCGVLPERVLKSHITDRTPGNDRFEKLSRSPEFNDRICLVYKRQFRQLKRGKLFVEACLAKWGS